MDSFLEKSRESQHLKVCQLWLQGRIASGHVVLLKVPELWNLVDALRHCLEHCVCSHAFLA